MAKRTRMRGLMRPYSLFAQPWSVRHARTPTLMTWSLSGSRYTSFRHGGLTPGSVRAVAAPAPRVSSGISRRPSRGRGALAQVEPRAASGCTAGEPRTRRRRARVPRARAERLRREGGRRGSRARRASSRSRPIHAAAADRLLAALPVPVRARARPAPARPGRCARGSPPSRPRGSRDSRPCRAAPRPPAAAGSCRSQSASEPAEGGVRVRVVEPVLEVGRARRGAARA